MRKCIMSCVALCAAAALAAGAEKEKPAFDGLFVSVGKIRVGDDKKASVEIFAKGTNGHVVVDAAQLMPEK